MNLDLIPSTKELHSVAIDAEIRVLDYYYNQCYGFSVCLVKDK